MAGWITSIVPFACLLLSPPFGMLVDWFGHRITLMGLGCLLMAPCYALLALTTWNPIPPILLLAIAFAAVPASLWPAVSLVALPVVCAMYLLSSMFFSVYILC